MKSKRFDWSDVWVFLSITNRDGTSLDNIIAIADILNHAIPTDNEFEKAINHLSSAGFVHVEGESFRLTEAGYELHELIRKKRGGLFTLVDRMEKHLNRHDFPIIDLPEFKLRPGQLDKAYDTYHARVHEIRLEHKKKNKTKSKIKISS